MYKFLKRKKKIFVIYIENYSVQGTAVKSRETCDYVQGFQSFGLASLLNNNTVLFNRVTATLFQVPNEPIVFAVSEKLITCNSFVTYVLKTSLVLLHCIRTCRTTPLRRIARKVPSLPTPGITSS